MEGKKLIAKFDGNYGRKGEIWLESGVCDVCGFTRVCLQIDASKEEYNAGAICLECIKRAFAGLMNCEPLPFPTVESRPHGIYPGMFDTPEA